MFQQLSLLTCLLFLAGAILANDKGNYDQAEQLYLQAISAFKEAIQQHPTDTFLYVAIAQAQFEIFAFDKAKFWYQKAIDLAPEVAEHHIGWGLATLSNGALEEGKKAIFKGMALAPTQSTKVIDQLMIIANINFENGFGATIEGDEAQGLDYKEFALGTLLVAHELDSLNRPVIEQIIEYSRQLKEEQTQKHFEEKRRNL